MIIFQRLLDLLTLSERKQTGFLLAMIVVMAGLDMIGVASIMPFMAVLANPQLVETNPTMNMVFLAASKIGVVSVQNFFLLLGTTVFLLLVFSLAFKAFTTYILTRFMLMRECSISKRLVEGYLHQPYGWFLSRHSAELGKNILSEVSQVIYQAMIPAMNLIAHSIVASAFLLLLILNDPMLALTVGLVLGASYSLIFKFTGSFLNRIGNEYVKANNKRFNIVSEAFGASKEIKLAGLESIYIERFAAQAEIFAKNQASAQAIGQIPRFALEAIAFGGLLVVILYLMVKNNNFATALPIIALYAFAGYRLLPALQQIYSAVTQIRYSGPALKALHKDVMGLKMHDQPKSGCSVLLNKAIVLNKAFYSYPNASQPSLKGINITIPAKSKVGLVGPTGSGKTTLIDIILGLLEVQEGVLEIDGTIINSKNRQAWQRSIGYVPQQIYLADDTIAANIAFGIEKKNIDQQAVERAAKIANLHDLVIKEFPKQYETTVGERGVRLSGGQRQRIGIARAMYNSPQVLILDEATSALDNLTEEIVMDAVKNLGDQTTIIMVAHRLSTVKECDIIYLLEGGKISAHGDFQGLINANENFKKMAAR